jgi:predicted DCC family thiol-disulfide oxidoreductase YuxK
VSSGTAVLVFDGDCGFCSSAARWVSAGWHGPAHAVPWQELSPAELAGFGLTEDDARRTVWWLDAGGRRFSGHRAVAHSLAAGRGWRRALGRLLLVPPLPWLGAAVYPLVVRNRHRLPGGTPACRT